VNRVEEIDADRLADREPLGIATTFVRISALGWRVRPRPRARQGARLRGMFGYPGMLGPEASGMHE
jgi:hypothetical protein